MTKIKLIPPPLLFLLASFGALLVVAIVLVVDSGARQPLGWALLGLALIVYAVAVWRAIPLIKMGIQMRRMMKAAKAGTVPVAAPVSAKKPPATAVASEPGGASCDGDWAITMDTPMGAQEMTLTLRSRGDELTGRADTPFGVQEFDGGVVKGDNIAWAIDVTTPMPMTLKFKATIIGDKLGGTAEVAGMGESPFEGVRKV